MQLTGTDLTARRGGEILFSGLDFSLAASDLLTVTGPNGAGKSTLLRIIAGLHEPITGSVHIEEGDTVSSPALFSHYLGDKNAMKPTLSVGDNLHFWGSYPDAQACNPRHALEAVELAYSLHLPYGMLSTGQKRRVALARLLVIRRPVWILDEPTSGLDSAAASLFSTIMKRHLLSGGMIVAATHLPLGLGAAFNITLSRDET